MFQIRLIYNKENPISSGFWTLEECIFNSGYWVRRYWSDGKELRTGDFDEWNVATGTEYDNSTNHYVYQNEKYGMRSQLGSLELTSASL
jgi:hypothetical protein